MKLCNLYKIDKRINFEFDSKSRLRKINDVYFEVLYPSFSLIYILVYFCNRKPL